MNFYYDQLSGALGILKQNGVSLDWKSLDKFLREVSAKCGPHDCDQEPVVRLHRQFRSECLSRGLIQRGELFNPDDVVPLD